MTIYLLEIIANSIQNWFRKIFMLKISNCPLLSLLSVIRLNRCTLYYIDTYHFFFILFSPHQNHTYAQVLSTNVFIAIVYTLKCQTLSSFCQKVPYASFSFTCVLGSSSFLAFFLFGTPKKWNSVMEKRYRKRKYKQWLARLPIERHYNRVIEMCTKYLERKLSTTNSIHTLIFAHSHGMDRLYRLTASFIDVHFESVFTSDEFFELSIDEMITLMPLLIYDEMNESDMQNALLLWYKYKRIERKQRGVVMR